MAKRCHDVHWPIAAKAVLGPLQTFRCLIMVVFWGSHQTGAIKLGYKIAITSDTAYRELVAEIVFDNGELMVVSQERSTNQFEVSMYSRYQDSDPGSGPLLIDFETFSGALADAKQKLISFSARRA